uniref:Uncharacterized protein n=1 Tax=Solanum tuberosum TaxID=4113 RepID=M1DYC2_SOLTU
MPTEAGAFVFRAMQHPVDSSLGDIYRIAPNRNRVEWPPGTGNVLLPSFSGLSFCSKFHQCGCIRRIKLSGQVARIFYRYDWTILEAARLGQNSIIKELFGLVHSPHRTETVNQLLSRCKVMFMDVNISNRGSIGGIYSSPSTTHVSSCAPVSASVSTVDWLPDSSPLPELLPFSSDWEGVFWRITLAFWDLVVQLGTTYLVGSREARRFVQLLTDREPSRELFLTISSSPHLKLVLVTGHEVAREEHHGSWDCL